MVEGKLNLLIGISFGSEGKGNVAAYLGERNKLDLCISNNSPNAGHCYKENGGTGESHIIKMLPVSGIVNKESNILLGSGSVINLDRLLEEIKTYDVGNRLLISATAPVVNKECIAYEEEHLRYISSTFQGTGAAIGFKAMRSPKIKLVKDYPELEKYCHKHIADIILNRLGTCGYTGLAEICQGYGLSVDSEMYPFTTSRPVNVGQALAYLDVPPSIVGDVIGIARTYIIRVGNVPDGYSGDTFFDSKELSWEEMSKKLGYNVLEKTTVTKRVRRVFSFSRYLFEQAVRRNGVNVLYVTFADYLIGKERQDFIDYVTSNKFNFKEIFFVSGYGQYDKFIEKIK